MSSQQEMGQVHGGHITQQGSSSSAAILPIETPVSSEEDGSVSPRPEASSQEDEVSGRSSSPTRNNGVRQMPRQWAWVPKCLWKPIDMLHHFLGLDLTNEAIAAVALSNDQSEIDQYRRRVIRTFFHRIFLLLLLSALLAVIIVLAYPGVSVWIFWIGVVAAAVAVNQLLGLRRSLNLLVHPDSHLNGLRNSQSIPTIISGLDTNTDYTPPPPTYGVAREEPPAYCQPKPSDQVVNPRDEGEGTLFNRVHGAMGEDWRRPWRSRNLEQGEASSSSTEPTHIPENWDPLILAPPRRPKPSSARSSHRLSTATISSTETRTLKRTPTFGGERHDHSSSEDEKEDEEGVEGEGEGGREGEGGVERRTRSKKKKEPLVMPFLDDHLPFSSSSRSVIRSGTSSYPVTPSMSSTHSITTSSSASSSSYFPPSSTVATTSQGAFSSLQRADSVPQTYGPSRKDAPSGVTGKANKTDIRWTVQSGGKRWSWGETRVTMDVGRISIVDGKPRQKETEGTSFTSRDSYPLSINPGNRHQDSNPSIEEGDVHEG